MKIINFGMYGWVIGKATLKAHPFTMNLFDVYCRGEIVNSHSHSLLFVLPCIIIVPPYNLFRILTLEAFRKCILLYTSDLNLLRFMGLNVKWAVFRKNTDVTQFHPRLKNMTSYKKRAIFDLLFTFFTHQGRVTKVPTAYISLTYVHVFCLPYWLFLP